MWIARLAGPRLTAGLLSLLGLAVVVDYLLAEESRGFLVVACAASTVNLVAALLTQPRLRVGWALFVFHLALALLLVLVALSRLTYLKAAAEVTEGGEFEELTHVQAGPWHAGTIERVRFRHEALRIEYLPGPQRHRTASAVTVLHPDGRAEPRTVADGAPLVLENYRFLPTHNKGFAPILRWTPTGGAAVTGSVHLPSYPGNADAQWAEWSIPGGPAEPVLLALLIDEVVLPEERASVLAPPAQHRLAVRLGDQRHELRRGGSLDLPGGRVDYLELRLWMGYQVFYDWTIPWLLATTGLAVFALAAHFLKKFAARPWTAA